MSESIRMPSEYSMAGKKIFGFFTFKQLIMIGIGGLIAGILAIYVPGSIEVRGATGGIIFFIFVILGLGRYHKQSLFLYLGGMFSYRLKSRNYVKVTSDKSSLLPVQNWLGLRGVVDDVVVVNPNMYLSMLSVTPIDIGLRTTEARESLYSVIASSYNMIDFPFEIIVKPALWDSTPYTDSWKEKLHEYEEDSSEAHLIRRHIEEFEASVRDYKIMKRNFYVIVSSRIKEIDPDIIKREKLAVRGERDSQKKKEIRKKYNKLKLEKANEDLHQKQSTIISAFEGVDPNLKVYRISGDDLVDSLRICFGGV